MSGSRRKKQPGRRRPATSRSPGKRGPGGGQHAKARSAQSGRRRPLLLVLLTTVIAAGSFAVWQLVIRTERPSFDQDQAFEDLETLVAFGPRAPGTSGHAAAADWIAQMLEPLADQLSTQRVAVPADGDTLFGTNIIASFNLEPEENRRIMLSTHWDTRSVADEEPDSTRRLQPIPGANDGGSGVAVLLELARALRERAPRVGVDLLFFDLEDAGRDSTIAFALGSEYFAANSDHYRPSFGINVDMVCDRNLEIRREFNSVRAAPRIVELVWDAAQDEEATAFLDRVGTPIMDDHIPFLQRQIPVINVIHSPFPSYWHTLDDTIDNCSRSSLGQVGRVLLRVVYDQ